MKGAIYIRHVVAGTGIITKTELKFFYTAFMDVGKLGDTKLEDFTNNAYDALTSVSNNGHWVMEFLGSLSKISEMFA